MSQAQIKVWSNAAWSAVRKAAELAGVRLYRPERGTFNSQLDRIEAKVGDSEPWRSATELWWRMTLSPEGRRVARRVALQARGPMPLEDCVQEGLLGVYRAARIFEPWRGFQFATVARWWARAQITRAIDSNGRALSVSSPVASLLFADRKLPAGLTRQERARRLGVPVERLDAAIGVVHVTSLDAPVNLEGPRSRGDRFENEGLCFLEFLESSDLPADEALDARRAVARVRGAVDELDARTQHALKEYFLGGPDAEGMTLSEVGLQVGISRERVRQVISTGLDEVRRAVGAE